jgi:hypothetical protein
MRLADDGSCSYHCCDQNGHSVCRKVADHYARLAREVRGAILDGAIQQPQADALLAILAEDPDTSTTG